MRAARSLLILACGCAGLAAAADSPAAPASYYVDSASGSDARDGRSPGTAWRSLEPVGKMHFGPGARLLLKAGLAYSGPLSLQGRGTAQAPIVVGKYGAGPRPHLSVGPGGPPVLSLFNSEYWEIGDLELSGGAIGVLAYVKDFGVAHHLRFRALNIHDVPGGTTGDTGGFLCKREGVQTWFDDLRIEGCTIEHADRNGILLTDYPTASDKHHSTRVVIRGNRLRDIGGDGIFILGCDGAVMEGNVVRRAHQRVGRGPGERACAGMWPHRCNGTVVQLNEVSETAVGGATVWDSEAFDDDNSCRGTVFQYNYSHDNAGGFLLICGGARGTVVRYNISQNDAIALFSLEGDGVGDVTVCNNTFYVGPGLNVNLARNTFGHPRGVRFLNNLFYADGTLGYDFGATTEVSFSHNAFWGHHRGRPADPAAILADPLLAAPGTGRAGRGSLVGYKLQPGSPCRGAGATVPHNGGRDFWGRDLPRDRPPSVGADEG